MKVSAMIREAMTTPIVRIAPPGPVLVGGERRAKMRWAASGRSLSAR